MQKPTQSLVTWGLWLAGFPIRSTSRYLGAHAGAHFSATVSCAPIFLFPIALQSQQTGFHRMRAWCFPSQPSDRAHPLPHSTPICIEAQAPFPRHRNLARR